MAEITPSILSANLWHFGQDIKQLTALGIQQFHVDIMDHHFVPNLAYGAEVVRTLKKNSEALCDVHLMVEGPEAFLDEFIAAGADWITIHFESTPHCYRCIQYIQSQGVKAGLALNPGTSLDSVSELLPLVDRLLIMTVNPGFGGQHFIKGQLAKIQAATQWKQAQQAKYDIQVDGGINDQTATLCIEAGAEVLVSGSYLFQHEDWAQALASLQ